MTSSYKDPLSSLEENVNKFVCQNEFGLALDSIKKFVETVVLDSNATAELFWSSRLDVLCEFVAGNFCEISEIEPQLDGFLGSVFLLSEITNIGGHVEVLKDILGSGQIAGPVYIFITDFLFRQDPSIVSKFERDHDVSVLIIRGSDLSEKLKNGHLLLKKIRPEKIFLFLYNQDSVGITISHFGLSKEVLFIHHADHHLCLGASSKKFIHVDLHNMGFYHCRERDHRDNHYLPLMLDLDGVDSENRAFLSQKTLTTCSSGRAVKFESEFYRFDYALIIPRILAYTGGIHIHIGDLSDNYKKTILDELKNQKVSAKKFIHINSVKSLARALVELEVDLFIGSFPLGGGKSSIEAMAAGVPLLMHESYKSKFFDGLDLVHKDAWTWSNENEIFTILSQITPKSLAHQSKLGINYVKKYHSKEVFKKALNFSEPQNLKLVPPLSPRNRDALEAYFERQHTQYRKENALKREIERVNGEWLIAKKMHSEVEVEKLSLNAEIASLNAEIGSLRIRVANFEQLTRSFRFLIFNFIKLLIDSVISLIKRIIFFWK